MACIDELSQVVARESWLSEQHMLAAQLTLAHIVTKPARNLAEISVKKWLALLCSTTKRSEKNAETKLYCMYTKLTSCRVHLALRSPRHGQGMNRVPFLVQSVAAVQGQILSCFRLLTYAPHHAHLASSPHPHQGTPPHPTLHPLCLYLEPLCRLVSLIFSQPNSSTGMTIFSTPTCLGLGWP